MSLMYYSIITINYNNKEGLEQTIKSVLSQTFRNYQFIIIDGGSSDGSVDVIKKYANNINYWISEPDKGRYNAMNKGIKQAIGDYLNFMNSGDTFHSPTVLEDIAKMNLSEDIITGGFSIVSDTCIHAFFWISDFNNLNTDNGMVLLLIR